MQLHGIDGRTGTAEQSHRETSQHILTESVERGPLDGDKEGLSAA